MLILPLRVDFPVLVYTYAQTTPPAAGSFLKRRLRRAAQRGSLHALYYTPICTAPPLVTRTERGGTWEVNTLGRWLFGVPRYHGNLDLLSTAHTIEIRLYSDQLLVRELIEAAAKKLGWRLLSRQSP